MALYLGGQRVAPTNSVSIPVPVPINGAVTGEADVDENGILHFPKLYFTPKMIVVWTIEARDLKQEALNSGEEWEEGMVRYIYNGIMLTAINIDGLWITQGLTGKSGEVVISNASWKVGSLVSFNGSNYSYDLTRYDGYPNDSIHEGYDPSTFNYAIYS